MDNLIRPKMEKQEKCEVVLELLSADGSATNYLGYWIKDIAEWERMKKDFKNGERFLYYTNEHGQPARLDTENRFCFHVFFRYTEASHVHILGA